MKSVLSKLSMLLGLSLTISQAATSPVLAQSSANVTVNAGTSLGAISPAAFGLNTACWDGLLLDSSLPNLLKQGGATILRFPGGTTSDNYHYADNSPTVGSGQYINPADTFDAFMGVKNQAGVGSAMVTVNYGTNRAGTGGGDPAEAAGWVQYANITKGYGVKYWEIGNEVYGNGVYGASWEPDLHTDHTPTAYGTNASAYITAMKAVDPTIKVGVVLCAPGNWPDGSGPDWNTNVLAQCGTKIDAVVVHWYPQGPGAESDAGLLAAPTTSTGGTPSIAVMVSRLRSLINTYCGANAPNVQIWVTETNSVSYNQGKQTVGLVNALFMADDYMTWLESGVSSVDWWALHNGPSTTNNNSASLYGTATFGDYGILSVGAAPEPAAETPFPSYYGFQILSYLGRPADTMVSASSNSSSVAVHAVKQANGNLALLLINKDLNNTYNVTVTLSGYTPNTSATVFTYGKTSSTITSSNQSGIGTTFTVSTTPYSLTTVVLSTGTITAPSAPTGLSASSGNGQVTLAWSASSGATSYNVSRSTVSGSGYASVATGLSTTGYTNTGLTDGTTYYFVVSATNSAGTSGNSAQASATPSAPPATPTGLSATGGNSQVALSWTASAGATGYSVKSAAVSGGPYSLIAADVNVTNYTVTGLTNGTTTYFVVSATNMAGESANSAQASATPQPPGTSGPAKINCGGALANPFVADADFVGGTAASNNTGAVDTSAVTGPAPVAVYQSERWGPCTYTVGGLTVGGSYTVRLHFTEDYCSGSGQRQFNVGINGTQVLTNFDIYAAAGAQHKANIQQFSATANGSGQVVIALSLGAVQNPKIDGIEVNSTAPTTPPVPTGLSATAGSGQVSLTWTSSNGATSYNVSRSTTSGSGYASVATGIATTTYTNTGLANGTTYYFVVSATNTAGTSANSAQASATPLTAPAAPTGLTASAGSGSVGLSWTAAATATSYNVSRSTTSGSGYASVATGITITSYTNTGLTNGTTYYFVVSATNSAGTSGNSAQTSATPQPGIPGAPTGVTATPGNASVALSWTTSSGATSYNVLRSTVNGSGYASIATGIATTTYTNTGLTNGTTYYYVVTATNASSTSSNSAQAGATPTGSGLPSPWADTDIGGPGVAGSATYAGGTFTVKGSGGDIWNGSDQCNYMYQSLNGDGSIVAHVATEQNTDGWAKVGVMIRETVNANSAMACMIVSPTNGVSFQFRQTTGGGPNHNDGSGVAPYWVKLTRVGTAVTGFTSSDNVTWTQIGTTTISMATTVTIGLCVCAHNNGVLNTSTFDNVSVSGGGPVAPAPPTGLTATPLDGQVSLSWTASSGATSYSVLRSTVNGSGYASIATGLTVTNYSNTGLTNGTTYYYVATATNSIGTSGNSTQASATPTAASSTVAVNCGGGAAGSFLADAYFTGGTSASNNAGSVDVSAVTNPAPTAVYQSERYGNFTYTIPNLVANSIHTVRLHFTEDYWNAAGQRTFNVNIQGQDVLTSYDIYAAAGAQHKANIKQFTASANASGQIVIQFTTVVNNAKVDGIEIL